MSSFDLGAYLVEPAPTFLLILIAAWTGWRVSAWKSEADAAIQATKQALDDHEAGCETRGAVVDGKLDRMGQDIVYIRGKLDGQEEKA